MSDQDSQQPVSSNDSGDPADGSKVPPAGDDGTGAKISYSGKPHKVAVPAVMPPVSRTRDTEVDAGGDGGGIKKATVTVTDKKKTPSGSRTVSGTVRHEDGQTGGNVSVDNKRNSGSSSSSTQVNIGKDEGKPVTGNVGVSVGNQTGSGSEQIDGTVDEGGNWGVKYKKSKTF